MTLHVAMEAASFLLEVFIKASFCLPFLGGGCIDFHRDRVVLLFPKEPMGIGLPFGWLRKGLAMLREGFFHDTVAADLSSSGFFPTVYGGGPSIPIKDPLEDASFESVLEFFYGAYFSTRNSSLGQEVLEFGNVIIDQICFHFVLLELHVGLFDLPSVNIGVLECLFKVVP